MKLYQVVKATMVDSEGHTSIVYFPAAYGNTDVPLTFFESYAEAEKAIHTIDKEKEENHG